jgi:hypothetical protein
MEDDRRDMPEIDLWLTADEAHIQTMPRYFADVSGELPQLQHQSKPQGLNIADVSIDNAISLW